MVDHDLIEFTELLDSVCMMLTRGQYRPNEISTGIFFNSLVSYPMDAVRAAFAHHVKVCRFAPTPADLIDYLSGVDGRLGAEEAWAEVLQAQDEAVTMVWTPEMAQAWGVARRVMPDEVGARMAFKEAYNRLVGAAREQRMPLQWTLALGFDLQGRAEAVVKAVAQGRQVHVAEGLLALPTARAPVALLEGPLDALPTGLTPVGLAAIKRMRDSRTASRQAKDTRLAALRERSAELKAAAAAKAEDYAVANGIDLTAPPALSSGSSPGTESK